MYVWVPSVVCPKLTPLYINYMTNGFVSVVWKRIVGFFSRVSCLFFKPTSLLHKSILVGSLIYFSSLHPHFVSLLLSSLLSIFWAYILASRVYFSRVSCIYFRGYILAFWIYSRQVSCIFFNPTSLLRKSILFKYLVYFSSLHPGFTSLF